MNFEDLTEEDLKEIEELGEILKKANEEVWRRMKMGLRPIRDCCCHGSNTAHFTLGECPCQGIREPRLDAPEHSAGR